MENWSAFAPDFKELDENVEYEERESEFDVEDEDRSVDQTGESHNDEELEVSHYLNFSNVKTLYDEVYHGTVKLTLWTLIRSYCKSRI